MTPLDGQQRAAGERDEDHGAEIIALFGTIDPPETMSKEDAAAMLSECRQTLHKDEAL